jgi:predicted nucleic acid-binding protein
MIVLDTNVVAEPMKPQPAQSVVAWLDDQVAETLYLTATNLSELLTGIAVLPKGRRRDRLFTSMSELLQRLFDERVLPFDREAAVAYATLVARAKAKGRGVSVAHAQIAAVADIHGFTIATRDTEPFNAMGVSVINPWQVCS